MTAGYDSAAEDRSRTKRRTADQGDSYTTDQGWFVHSTLDDEQHHPTIGRLASGPRTRPCWMVTTRDRRRRRHHTPVRRLPRDRDAQTVRRHRRTPHHRHGPPPTNRRPVPPHGRRRTLTSPAPTRLHRYRTAGHDRPRPRTGPRSRTNPKPRASSSITVALSLIARGPTRRATPSLLRPFSGAATYSCNPFPSPCQTLPTQLEVPLEPPDIAARGDTLPHRRQPAT